MTDSRQFDLAGVFNDKAAPTPAREKKQRTVPLSIRVTAEEKARLEAMAGAQALSTYVRQKLLGEDAAARPKRYRKKPQAPGIDHVEVARLLGMFGRSELATSILALNLAIESGEWTPSPEIEERITRACTQIHEIRLVLIHALGVKPQGG